MSEADQTKSAPDKKKLAKRLGVAAIILVCLAGIIFAIVMAVAKGFTEQEHAVRSDWSVETGDMLVSNEDLGLDIYESSASSDQLRIIQMVPTEVSEEGFTYYDADVQNRLAQALAEVKDRTTWTADAPLAGAQPLRHRVERPVPLFRNRL